MDMGYKFSPLVVSIKGNEGKINFMGMAFMNARMVLNMSAPTVTTADMEKEL